MKIESKNASELNIDTSSVFLATYILREIEIRCAKIFSESNHKICERHFYIGDLLTIVSQIVS